MRNNFFMALFSHILHFYVRSNDVCFHTHTHTHTQQQQQQQEEDSPTRGRAEKGMSTISRPIRERRAARLAVERLSEITKDVGIQVNPSSKETASVSSKDDMSINVFGFTHDEMNVFKLKIDQDRLVECPVEVRMILCMCLKMKSSVK